MDNSSKIIGSNGGFFMDNSFTGGFVYAISVLEAATFTVLKEGTPSGGSSTDVMSDQNLTGKTIPAGALLVPEDEVFRDATITAGSVYCYKVGE